MEYLQDYKAKESVKISIYLAEISNGSNGLEQKPYFDRRNRSALTPLVLADTDILN